MNIEPIRVKNLAVFHHEVPTPIARVLLVHGISEHSGRHLNTVNALTDNQIEVVRFDLRGAGQSEGLRQYVDRFEDYVEDVETVFEWQKEELQELPLFLLGHSLGGAISFYFFPKYQEHFRGFIASAPAYITGGGISPVLIKIGKMLANFFPKLSVPAIRQHGVLSRDPAVEEAYVNDPLSHHYNTLRQGNVILEALKAIPQKAAQISKPVMMVHGTADKIIVPSGSFEIFQKLKGQKELHYFPNGAHEPHNDTIQNEYFLLLKMWITRYTLKTEE